MVVTVVADVWVANNMDTIEETTETGVPDSLAADYTLYIPDFLPFHVHGEMTEEEMIAAHNLFQKKRLDDPWPHSRNQ
jgi:hypothetical protein